MAEAEAAPLRLDKVDTWFALLGAISNPMIVKYITADHVGTALAVNSILLAIVSNFIVYIVSKFSKPIGLIRYQSMLKRERNELRKSLKDNLISDEAKKDIQQKYDLAASRLATSESDYHKGDVGLNTEK